MERAGLVTSCAHASLPTVCKQSRRDVKSLPSALGTR